MEFLCLCVQVGYNEEREPRSSPGFSHSQPATLHPPLPLFHLFYFVLSFFLPSISFPQSVILNTKDRVPALSLPSCCCDTQFLGRAVLESGDRLVPKHKPTDQMQNCNVKQTSYRYSGGFMQRLTGGHRPRLCCCDTDLQQIVVLWFYSSIVVVFVTNGMSLRLMKSTSMCIWFGHSWSTEDDSLTRRSFVLPLGQNVPMSNT